MVLHRPLSVLFRERISRPSDLPPPPCFSQVLILERVKVVCFVTLFQVLILKRLKHDLVAPLRLMKPMLSGKAPLACKMRHDLLKSGIVPMAFIDASKFIRGCRDQIVRDITASQRNLGSFHGKQSH